MELIKLLFFLTLGIFIRQFSFFVIISMFWIMNFFIGIYLNREYFAKRNTLFTNLIYQLILFGELIYQKMKYLGNYFTNSSTGEKILDYTKTIDKMYLDGRRFLFKKFKQSALKNLPMPPMMPPIMPVLPNRGAFKSIRTNNSVLNKTEEIDNFLNGLIENKKDN